MEVKVKAQRCTDSSRSEAGEERTEQGPSFGGVPLLGPLPAPHTPVPGRPCPKEPALRATRQEWAQEGSYSLLLRWAPGLPWHFSSTVAVEPGD